MKGMLGTKILFWREQSANVLDDALSNMLPIVGRTLATLGDDPRDFVREAVSDDDRRAVIRALMPHAASNPTGGEYGIGYMGFATCRICGTRLGTRDMFGHGFMWPEKAEHYLEAHKVWTPGCEQLLRVVQIAASSASSKQ
jgi:hypothetical protein